MNRRNFMKIGLGLSISAAMPVSLMQAIAKTQGFNFASALGIPSIVKADAQGVHWITVQQGFTTFNEGVSTPTWGYNGNLLGPVLRAEQGSSIKIAVKNTLKELTTVHWHGLEIPGKSDGGPHEIILPNAVWQTQLDINQSAATCWFHPHTHNDTGRHVAMGLSGLFLIEDELSKTLTIPKNWGVDDLPIILQDKKLKDNGEINYQLDKLSAAVGWFGDLMLTNGAVMPFHKVAQGFVRLRLLNGCNARSLTVGFTDNLNFYVIASDGGFLETPVKLNRLDIYPGERFEIMVEIKGEAPIQLISFPVEQIGMALAPFDQALPLLQLRPSNEISKYKLPDSLAKLPALPNNQTLESLPIRKLQLSMKPELDCQGMQLLVKKYGEKAMTGISMHGMHNMDSKKAMPEMDHSKMSHADMKMDNELNLKAVNFINNQPFNMHKPAFDVAINTPEIWEISGVGDMMRHPFHIHGGQFRILQENDETTALHRQGRKDTVLVEGAVSRVLVEFKHKASADKPFMAHCHLLEHEDTGMMLGFTVS